MRLSPRQRETLALAATGLPSKLICERMGVTIWTVKAHLTEAYKRLGVHNRVQAVLLYQRGKA